MNPVSKKELSDIQMQTRVLYTRLAKAIDLKDRMAITQVEREIQELKKWVIKRRKEHRSFLSPIYSVSSLSS